MKVKALLTDWLRLFLLSCLLVTALSGCGGSGNAPDTPISQPPVAPPTSHLGFSSVVTLSTGRVPADGSSQIEAIVQLTPDSTSVDVNNRTVVINISAGRIGAVTQSGGTGRYVATITAPSTPGVATVTVTVEGVAVEPNLEIDFAAPGSGFSLLTVNDVSVAEGNLGSSQTIVVSATLSELLLAQGSVLVSYRPQSAKQDSDIPTYSTTHSIATGSLQQSFTLPVVGDTVYEANEFFYIDLSSPSSNIGLARTRIRVDLLNDDTRTLNDTGVAFCRSATTQQGACNSSADGTHFFTDQDAEHGRDVDFPSALDGRLGFSFSKLDNGGSPLADQSQSYAVTPWECIRDNTTGLLWGVKTGSGLHSSADRYTWLSLDTFTNGGAAGSSGSSNNSCFGFSVSDANSFCNTEAYISRVNNQGLCGLSNWRLPTIQELQGIVDHGVLSGATIDSDYFPNTTASTYWTATPTLGTDNTARTMDFDSGRDSVSSRSSMLAVRLVSDGG